MLARILSCSLALLLLLTAMARGSWVQCLCQEGRPVLASALGHRPAAHAHCGHATCTHHADAADADAACVADACDDQPLTATALIPDPVPGPEGCGLVASALPLLVRLLVPHETATAVLPPARGPPPHTALHRHLAGIVLLI